MANGPTFDLERVEVLKGPQGTLYGRNTTGGLVNFIASKPGDRFEGGLTTELGNYGTYNFEGYFNAPLSDTLALRSEEHTSELQSLMRISYAVFCLKKKKQI